MAKKQKFATETNDAAAAAEGISNTPAPVNLDAPKAPLIPRNPSLYLQNEQGVQYKFDRRELPKKAAVAGEILIDGESTPFQTTSNKGWAVAEEFVLEYIWVKLPSGVTGYITCDYTQAAASFAGQSFTVGEGVANRKNPDRKGDDAKEQARKAAAAATLAAKKAAAPAAPAEAPAEEAQPTE